MSTSPVTPPTMPKLIPCRFKYPDGSTCTDAPRSKGLCPRHYQQQHRGRLGKTREIERGSVRPSLTLTVSDESKAALLRASKKQDRSMGTIIDDLISHPTHGLK